MGDRPGGGGVDRVGGAAGDAGNDLKTAVAVPGSGDHWSALIAGYLGWPLDAFDFFLVVFCLTAIGHEFNVSDRKMALPITMTLAFRPVGAFLFGLMADRYGRRKPLM